MDTVDSGQLPGGHAPSHWYDTWDRQASQSFSNTTKGLRNAPGENNCFLNSAVQVFWHIDVFRRSYRRLSGHLCMGHSCIFCALKVIFTQFQYSDQASLQPSALRKALANTFAKQERFQLGHMDDAAECFENILHRIHYHIASTHNEDTCNAPHCIPHQKFAMTVCDQLVCPCGSKSEPLRFHELVHYISANALVSQTRTMQESGDVLHPNRFGLLLRNARAFGDVRDCPATCGKRVQIRRTLLNVPDVVSVGLVWGSDKPDIELTTEVARAIGTTLLLPDLFHSVMHEASKLPRLQLTSLVCYYGKHYSTFVYHTKLSSWVYFDDATVREVGPNFENVVEKIVRSRYQPLLLIYSNLNAQPVPTETAPSTRVMAPGYSMTPTKEETKTPAGVVKEHGGSSKKSLSPQLDKEGNPVSGEGSDKEHAIGRKSSFENRRQSSFLLAVTKQKYKDENIYAVPHNNAKVQGMQKDLRLDVRQNFVKTSPAPGYYGDIPDGPEDPDGYNYTLSTSDQYRRPGLSSPDPVKLPLTQNFSRVNEAQRKDSFKKGKGKVGADVIRYHVDGTRRTSVSSESDPGSPVHESLKGQHGMNGKPALPEKPKHVRTRSQSLEDNIGNVCDPGSNVSHKIVKPTPSAKYENVDIPRAHTPVQSGLATLPRNKKSNSKTSAVSSTSLTMPSSSMPQGGHPTSGSPYSMMSPHPAYPQESPPPPYIQNSTHSGYQNCLSYQNVVDADHHSRQSSSSSILSQNTVVECGNNDDSLDNAHIRQSSSVSTDTLTETSKPPKEPKAKSKRKDKEESSKKKGKEEKKLKSKKEKSSQGSSKGPQVPPKKLASHPDEGFSDEQFYIDPRMVESVLSFQKLQRSGSCVSQASTSSVESDSYKGRPVVPKDNLSAEIPFDAASLDSHKDSGYGSSDRNSSSSTGSVTMNPYEQYFLSRSMIPPKTFNPQVMAENMRLLMDNGSGMKGLEYTTEKDLKSLVTGPMDQYKQSNTVAYVQQHQQQVQPNLQPGKDLRHMTKEERNQHLYDALSGNKKGSGHPQLPVKPQLSSLPQGQENQGPPTGSRPNDKGLHLGPDGHPQQPLDSNNHDAMVEQFMRLCQRAEELMDSCVLAETSGQFVDAQSHCQQAISVLQGAIKLPNIGQKSFTFAQHLSNSCLLKLRSLQKRLINRQESNMSTNSNDSGINQDFRRTHQGQLKHPQHLQLTKPPSRSGSQNSMDSLKDGSTSSGSGRSNTPVFDKSGRAPIEERVPPVNIHIGGPMVGEFQAGLTKDRSFESSLPENSVSGNADLYGTLPRRKTQKSQDHVKMCNNSKQEADIYQDFLDNQRRQTGGPSRTSSGSRTPVNDCNDQFSNQQAPPMYPGRQFTPSTASQQNRSSGMATIPVVPPTLGNQSSHTESQPDLRQLSGEIEYAPQRPLTPQVLCSESSTHDEAESHPVSVQDLKSRFESAQISVDAANKPSGGKKCDTNNVHPRLAPVNSVPNFVPAQDSKVTLQRQRSKSESESLAQQPPRPKSALSKRNRFGPSTRPRKSVTFSENICLVAALDNFGPSAAPDHVTQAGYQSDEEDRVDFTVRHQQEDEDSSSSGSPVELVQNGLCSLCHKHGVEVGQSYCPKCTFYMSRFTPSR